MRDSYIFLDTNVGEVGLFDNQDEEEATVFLPDDPAIADSDSDDSDDSDDSEVAYVLQSRRRVRGCPAKCDCERERGRKCLCERRGDGMCSEECQCNSTLCRTQIHGGSSSDEAADDSPEE